MDTFDSSMNKLLHIHAPDKTKTIVLSPNTRRFNGEIMEAEKTQREAESRGEIVNLRYIANSL